ncbi:MAG: aspartate 1-decarboxylase [Firmicutes bacterium]|nr:aspartate 1-decarboxylase [Bacillota bacterium]
MLREMCKAKIHRATVTDANLHYEGSITIDEELLVAADILPYEKVQIVNINNGARFETYVIKGKRGSGTICLNGAAARLVQPGDLIIIISYALVEEEKIEKFKPKIIYVDANNRIINRKEKEG